MKILSDKEQHDLKMLNDSIQRTYNRIHYDRTISDDDRQTLQKGLTTLEEDKKTFFGKEDSNG
jgi:hypothetical protein